MYFLDEHDHEFVWSGLVWYGMVWSDTSVANCVYSYVKLEREKESEAVYLVDDDAKKAKYNHHKADGLYQLDGCVGLIARLLSECSEI